MLKSFPFLLAQLKLEIWGKDDEPSDEDDEDEVVDNLISSGPSRFSTAEHYGHG